MFVYISMLFNYSDVLCHLGSRKVRWVLKFLLRLQTAKEITRFWIWEWAYNLRIHFITYHGKTYIYISLIDYYFNNNSQLLFPHINFRKYFYVSFHPFPSYLSSIALGSCLSWGEFCLLYVIFELNLAKLHQIDRLILIMYLNLLWFKSHFANYSLKLQALKYIRHLGVEVGSNWWGVKWQEVRGRRTVWKYINAYLLFCAKMHRMVSRKMFLQSKLFPWHIHIVLSEPSS